VALASLIATGAAAAAPAEPPVASVTVTGAPPPTTPAITYAPPKVVDQKDNQLVCRTEPVLGTRLPVRRCRSVGDMKDRTLNDRQMVEHVQENLQLRSN
ncbi:MAG TPA: hypothetical protein VGH86_02685, partial [Phenylobacterium sp.]